MLNKANGGTATEFGAVIFTRKDRRDIKDIEDLKGKRFMAVHRNAFGGWWMAKREIKRIENLGYGGLPICMAKTPASLTDDPKVPGRPQGFTIRVTSARVSAGAGFVVVYTGDVMTMPGLAKQPAALNIDVDDSGTISGLF